MGRELMDAIHRQDAPQALEYLSKPLAAGVLNFGCLLQGESSTVRVSVLHFALRSGLGFFACVSASSSFWQAVRRLKRVLS